MTGSGSRRHESLDDLALPVYHRESIMDVRCQFLR